MAPRPAPPARKTRTPAVAERAFPVEERVFQSLLRASDHLLWGEIEVLRVADLTFPQYNVLRILRGAQPDGLACGAISERMITRDSDLTRLLDRLQTRGLVARGRDAKDRRIVTAHITGEGLTLLRRLDTPIARVHREQLRHMGRDQLERLCELATLLRRPAGRDRGDMLLARSVKRGHRSGGPVMAARPRPAPGT